MKNYETEYLIFERWEDSKSGKTQTWGVRNKRSNDLLGDIGWHGPWRQYVFDPYSAIFNAGCLRDIAYHMLRLMDERKGVTHETVDATTG